MSLSKGKIISKTEKHIKNKKLENIRNCDINIDISKEKDCIKIELNIEGIIEPAPRPRTATVYKKDDNGNVQAVGSRIYDPLASYKDYLKKLFINLILDNSDYDIFPFDGYCEVELEISKVPPKSWSIKNKYYAIKNILKNINKPDLDNAEKTLYDCLSKIMFTDDAIIHKSKSYKFYSYENHTKAIFRLYKMDIPKGRLNKEQLEEWKEMENKIIYKEN